MQWKTSSHLVPYPEALAFMEARVAEIRAGDAEECVWLLEHPPLYTAGTSAKESGLLDAMGFPVYETGRGGEHTYHGPGQRIAYVMLDLKKRAQIAEEKRNADSTSASALSPSHCEGQKAVAGDIHKVQPDIRAFVKQLEEWIIRTLAAFDVEAFTREGRIGVWTDTPQGECKVAALGIRVRHWVTFHGISINVNPNLSHFNGIIPCGISNYGVTSLEKLEKSTSMDMLDNALKCEFEEVFAKV